MLQSISFPPGTISSKLSSKKLKRPPSPKDWMHQTYLQMIQDVSYATSHYYESKDNGNQLLFGGPNKVGPCTETPKEVVKTQTLIQYDSDSSDDNFNTFSTTSTDCNRRNNIYNLYRAQPVGEEDAASIIRVATPDNSSVDQKSVVNSLNSNSSSSNTNKEDAKQHGRKKKFKLFKNMVTKMRVTAENPFWVIDRHF